MPPVFTIFYRRFNRLGLAGLFLLAVLSGCGLLEVQIQPLAPAPTLTSILPTPTPTLTPQPSFTTSPTQRAVVTETPSQVAPKTGLRPGTPLQILQIHMLDLHTGWAIGQAEGTSLQRILFTSDDGASWQDRTPPEALASASTADLTATAYFASAQVAWAAFAPPQQAAGSAPLFIWRTSDGGKTWAASKPLDLSGIPMQFQIPSDLSSLDGQTGWLLVHLGVGMSHDYIAIFTTADGGATWQRRVDPNSPDPIMPCSKSGLVFTSPSSAWLTGNCPGLMTRLFFYHSLDTGQSWTDASLPVPDGKPSDYFAQPGIACGITALSPLAGSSLALTLSCTNSNNNTNLSWLYLSQDGLSWTQHVLPVANNQISYLDPLQFVLIGANRLDETSGGEVFVSVNAGSTWTHRASTGWTGAPSFVDLQNGWVIAVHAQVRAFVRTHDGGVTWEEIKPVSAP